MLDLKLEKGEIFYERNGIKKRRDSLMFINDNKIIETYGIETYINENGDEGVYPITYRKILAFGLYYEYTGKKLNLYELGKKISNRVIRKINFEKNKMIRVDMLLEKEV